MKLKALKGHSYAGKYQKPGSVYEAKDRDGRALILVKQSEEYIAPAPKPRAKPAAKQEVDDKAMTAEEKPRRGRPPTYQTRQMVSDSD